RAVVEVLPVAGEEVRRKSPGARGRAGRGRSRRRGGRGSGRGRRGRRGRAAGAVVGPHVPLPTVGGRGLVLGPPLRGVVVAVLRGLVAAHVDRGGAPRRGAGGGGVRGAAEVGGRAGRGERRDGRDEHRSGTLHGPPSVEMHQSLGLLTVDVKRA